MTEFWRSWAQWGIKWVCENLAWETIRGAFIFVTLVAIPPLMLWLASIRVQVLGIIQLFLLSLVAVVYFFLRRGVLTKLRQVATIPQETSRNVLDTPFEVLDFYPWRSDDPATFKLKLRIVIRNKLDTGIFLREITWAAASPNIGVFPQPPLTYRFNLESKPGLWQKDPSNAFPYAEERPNIYVESNCVFAIWVGINAAHGNENLRQLHETKAIGTLTLLTDKEDSFAINL